MNTSRTLALIVAVVLTGCATPAPTQVETTRTFNAPYDKVWSAAVAQFSGTFPLKVVQKDSGIIETDFASLGTGLLTERQLKAYAVPPKAFLAVWTDARAKLSLYARTNSEGVSIRIKGHFEGYESNVGKSWHIWPSNGSLETSIMNKISADM